MKEVFTSKGSRDFRQRYEDTFGFFTSESGKRILVNITSVGDEGLNFTDSKRLNYTAVADADAEFEFLSPVKKLFSIDDAIYVIHRRPARQFQRGISSANTLIYDVTKGQNTSSVSFKRLTQAFAEDGYNVKRRMTEYLADKRETVLLSNMLAIAANSVYLYQNIIGTVDKSTQTVKLNDDLFRQEVLDCLRDNEIKFKVTV